MTDTKNTFKHTLNLPETSFPMKANLNQNEPKRLALWEETNAYAKIQEAASNAPAFIFHDGPPYANGDIHIGHLLNKVLKDLVVRSQFLLGKRCEFIPGWDCHGLPIEHKVLSEMASKKKEKISTLSPDNQRLAIRNECKSYAEKYIKKQTTQMKRLLTLANYSAPYLTFQPDYESNVLSVFSELIKEGLVFRQKKPVHWSIANQTALADAELEYKDKASPTIAVAFPMPTHPFAVDGPVHALIWTTTPWTLPANKAIAYGNHIKYVIATINGMHCIVAADRMPAIAEHCTITDSMPIDTHLLANLVAQHPFLNQPAPLLDAAFVSTEEGTGLVHIAPGHGTDDYQLGNTHGIDAYSPVLPDGTFDNTVPEWLQGVSIWAANSMIIEHLSMQHLLVYQYELIHSYPHDWRSKTPVIFRSTDQWFVGVDIPLKSTGKSLRDMALTTIRDDISFYPPAGQSRLAGMLETRPDWCISRQRSWGLPIPAFIDANGSVLLTPASVQHIASLIATHGSDIWFKQSPNELLSGYSMTDDTQAPQAFDIVSAEKLYDIFDVWFESGSSWHAVLQNRQDTSVADLYLEGSDQHRGWFHLSLLPSLAAQHKAPFKRVLTHGFIVDKDGRKMSKSTGNVLNVDTILASYGAEVTRWWVSGLSYENDIKVDESFFKEAGDLYRKIRNTFRFIISNRHQFDAPLDECLTLAQSFPPETMDAHILHQLGECEANVLACYESFEFRDASSAIYQFCTDSLSSFYLSAIKDRLYCDPIDSERRIRSQITLTIILHVLVRLVSPILPHTCDEAMASLGLPSIQGQPAIGFSYLTIDAWGSVMATRKTILKLLEDAKAMGIENSLDAGVCLPEHLDLAPFLPDLPDILGVSRVTIEAIDTPRIVDLRSHPRCERSWKRDTTVKEWPNGAVLSERDYHAITKNH